MSSLDNIHAMVVQLLNGEVAEIKLEYVSPGKLEEHGFILYEMETNGWQVDYWCDAGYDGNTVSLEGSMWYGTCTISLPEKTE